MKPIVVHGGGPQISDLMRRLGKEPEFVDGLRVTDAETVDIVRMALIGQVNRQIVTRMNATGPYGRSRGEDAGLIRVTQRDPRLGFVGDVRQVNPRSSRSCWPKTSFPWWRVSGSTTTANVYNVNADAIAAAVAESLGAQKLVYLTDVPGLLGDVEDPDSLIDSLDLDELDRLVANGAIHSGMVPKLESIAGGDPRRSDSAHILDGRIPHVLLVELFTNRGSAP
ncbi:MAG: acetylglutamate kinase [Acidimicrobiia bacterium]|nr:acetylglutamate kinase [Acidimicrobiia bacterium]